MKYKISNHAPKRATKIIIVGPPGSGRTTLAKELSRKFGFIYVSTKELILDLISKKGEAGQIALNQMNNGDLIPDDIISTLVHSRVN